MYSLCEAVVVASPASSVFTIASAMHCHLAAVLLVGVATAQLPDVDGVDHGAGLDSDAQMFSGSTVSVTELRISSFGAFR